MKWTLPVLLLLVACGGSDPVTETTVTTTTTTNTPVAGAAAGGAGGAAGGATDDVGDLEPALVGGTAVLAADAVAYACLSEEQRAQTDVPLTQAMAVLPSNVRILRPDALFTRDYRPNRVNADVDANEMVTRVWCG